MNLSTSPGILLTAIALSLSLISCGGGGGGGESQFSLNQAKIIADLADQQTALYADFKVKTSSLESSASDFCATPDDTGLTALQNQWTSAFLSWKKAEWVSLGPIEFNDQFVRIQSWPRIPSSRIPQRVNEMISSAPTPISQAYMSSRPVSVQGFPALEYLLFEAGITGTNITPEECAVLVAITVNLNTISTLVAFEWPSFSSDIRNPIANSDSVNFFANQMLRILVVIKDRKVGDPLGFDKTTGQAGTPVPEDSEAWRSRQSLPALLANMQTVQALHRGTTFGFDDFLESVGQNALSQNIDNQIVSLITTLQGLIDDGLTIRDDAADASIQALHASTRTLEVAVQNNLFPAIEATVGFNFNDGD